jgi:hypothetical protein
MCGRMRSDTDIALVWGNNIERLKQEVVVEGGVEEESIPVLGYPRRQR